MPITDQYHRLPISSITVRRDDRQRRTIETSDLESSIRRNGLINPIIVNSNNVLVAGERRLEACRRLGHSDISVRFLDELSPIESSIIELEENIKRSDLEWADLVSAVGKIHTLYCQLDPDWTQGETAAACSLTQPTISLYLSVWHQMQEGDPRIIEAGTVREAYNIISRREQRALGNALEELLVKPTPDELAQLGDSVVVSFQQSAPGEAKPARPDITSTILWESFLDWAPTYSGPKFNLIHCDFPYGISPFQGKQGRGAEPDQHYQDDEKTYFNLISCLCENLPRLSSVSCHIMFWFSEKWRDETLQLFTNLAPEIIWQPFPLIWVKSDNTGIASDPRRGPRHVYETCLLGSIGNRQIVRVVGDAYNCPSDQRLHPSTKPESMLRHFMTMLVDEHTSLLDPTCGSGTAIRAAESLGATNVIGLEQDWNYCESARLALRNFRTLRDTGI